MWCVAARGGVEWGEVVWCGVSVSASISTSLSVSVSVRARARVCVCVCLCVCVCCPCPCPEREEGKQQWDTAWHDVNNKVLDQNLVRQFSPLTRTRHDQSMTHLPLLRKLFNFKLLMRQQGGPHFVNTPPVSTRGTPFC